MEGTGETDSVAEEDGFEPSVPPEKGSTSSRCSTFPALPFERDRGFESAFLRQPVCLTGAFHAHGRKDPAFRGAVSLNETRDRDHWPRAGSLWLLFSDGH